MKLNYLISRVLLAWTFFLIFWPTVLVPDRKISLINIIITDALFPYIDMMNDLMAQTYASAVKWPKDQILAIRIGHIVKCIQDGKYPVEQGHSLGEILAELQDTDNSPFDSKSPDSNLRDTSTPLSESSDASKGQVQQRFKDNGDSLQISQQGHQGGHQGQSKIRQLLTSGTLNTKLTPVDEEEDPIAR